MSQRAYPQFIVFGALRSGTTLFRLMLGAHPEIGDVGEADYLFDYLHRNSHGRGWRYDIDQLKMDRLFQSRGLDVVDSTDRKGVTDAFLDQLNSRCPGHFGFVIHRNVDKAATLFPGTRFIHIIRDPRDVAVSCINMGWAGNTYFGVDFWIDTERNWDETQPRLQSVLEIRYRDLVSDPHTQLQRACKFLGISFCPKMLDYPATSTYGPPDPSAIQRWKSNLSRRAVELVEVKAGPLMLKRGYELSGYHPDPPGIVEKGCLYLNDKARKWKFAVSRYGVLVFLLGKLMRLLPIPPLHATIRARMNEHDTRHLR